jgi:hypothetical protein
VIVVQVAVVVAVGLWRWWGGGGGEVVAAVKWWRR